MILKRPKEHLNNWFRRFSLYWQWIRSRNGTYLMEDDTAPFANRWYHFCFTKHTISFSEIRHLSVFYSMFGLRNPTRLSSNVFKVYPRLVSCKQVFWESCLFIGPRSSSLKKWAYLAFLFSEWLPRSFADKFPVFANFLKLRKPQMV